MKILFHTTGLRVFLSRLGIDEPEGRASIELVDKEEQWLKIVDGSVTGYESISIQDLLRHEDWTTWLELLRRNQEPLGLPAHPWGGHEAIAGVFPRAEETEGRRKVAVKEWAAAFRCHPGMILAPRGCGECRP